MYLAGKRRRCFHFAPPASNPAHHKVNPRFLLLLHLLTLVFSAWSAAAPAAPIDCTAVTFNRLASSATVTVSWIDNSTNETAWQLYARDNTSSNFTPIGNVFASSSIAQTGSTFSVNWSFAQLNKFYQFAILAINASGSTPSNFASLRTDDLGAPFNFQVVPLDPFNVFLYWDEGSTSENGFSIERKIGSGPWTILTPTVSANIIDSGIKPYTAPLTEYSFRVRAYKGGAPTSPDSAAGSTAVSAYSPVVTMTAAAYNLSATPVPGQSKVNLAWPNISNETGYRIIYRSQNDFVYSILTTLAANTATYQATTPAIEPGNTYEFIVQPLIGSTPIGETNAASATVDGITSIAGASGLPGAAFSHSFTHASSASVSSRSLTGVPGGLAFNTGNGILSGVCPVPGVYPMNYTLNLSNGGVLTQQFSLRVRPVAGPPAVGTLIPGWNASAGGQRNTSLAGTFTDAEAESAVRVSTTLGNMDFILFNNATPATVTNFMSYVNAGKYGNVAFHRSVPGFVVQTGGFSGTGVGSNFTSVITSPPVINEPGISNLRGTIAMAKVGGNPNSATSQFFVNVEDNAGNLDYQNGGFTVFGRVAGNGMTVADAINALPRATYNLFLNGSATPTSFADFPMNAPVAPVSMNQANVVKILSVAAIPTLSYHISGNTQPDVATASVVNGELRISGLRGGQTTITVTATDLDNLTASQDIAVNLTDTFNTWAARTAFPNGQNGLLQNPDDDGLINLLEYAFFGDPAQSSEAQLPVMGTTAAPRTATIQFPVRKFTSGLRYVVEANNQLTGAWTEVWNSSQGFAHAQVVSAVDLADRTLVTIKDLVAMTEQPARFLRVKVVQN
jgi:cyclophilin family peptidyl-prolyl cis-trans isomerase